MRVTAVLGGLLLLAALAGCGSSGQSSQQLRGAVAELRSTIRTYNQSPQSDLIATAAACRQARSALAGNQTLLDPSSGSAALDTDLKNAYQQALAGFTDCAGAAPYNYQRMLRSQDELASANAWIARARTVR